MRDVQCLLLISNDNLRHRNILSQKQCISSLKKCRYFSKHELACAWLGFSVAPRTDLLSDSVKQIQYLNSNKKKKDFRRAKILTFQIQCKYISLYLCKITYEKFSLSMVDFLGTPCISFFFSPGKTNFSVEFKLIFVCNIKSGQNTHKVFDAKTDLRNN